MIAVSFHLTVIYSFVVMYHNFGALRPKHTVTSYTIYSPSLVRVISGTNFLET